MNAGLIAETDVRNEFGLPASIEVTAQPLAAQHTQIDQSVNKALPYVAVSWFLSGGAIVGLIMLALLMPELINAAVARGVSQSEAAASKSIAETRANFEILLAQVKADTTAIANTGREHARVALDKVEQTQTQLGAKGLIKVETH